MNASAQSAKQRARWPRRVVAELLDELPPDDPRALRSRRDLRVVNRIMGHAGVLMHALDAVATHSPLRLEALSLARQHGRGLSGVQPPAGTSPAGGATATKIQFPASDDERSAPFGGPRSNSYIDERGEP